MDGTNFFVSFFFCRTDVKRTLNDITHGNEILSRGRELFTVLRDEAVTE